MAPLALVIVVVVVVAAAAAAAAASAAALPEKKIRVYPTALETAADARRGTPALELVAPLAGKGSGGGRNDNATGAAQDACFDAKDCEECIARPLCGWCSTPVQGGNGAQCCGFAEGTPPFVCNGRYQTTKCLPPPPPPEPPMPPPPPPPIKPVVPPEVLGMWRGLRIENGFPNVIYHLNFTAQNVTIEGGGMSATAAVFSNDKHMNLRFTSGPAAGKMSFGIYELGFGPVTIMMTWASSDPGLTEAPKSFESAMAGEQAGVLLIYKNKQL